MRILTEAGGRAEHIRTGQRRRGKLLRTVAEMQKVDEEAESLRTVAGNGDILVI